MLLISPVFLKISIRNIWSFSRSSKSAGTIWEEGEYKRDKCVAFAILTGKPNSLIAPYHDRRTLALADNAIEA